MQHFNFQVLPVHIRHDLNANLYGNVGNDYQPIPKGRENERPETKKRRKG
jgi:hypothetical protein